MEPSFQSPIAARQNENVVHWRANDACSFHASGGIFRRLICLLLFVFAGMRSLPGAPQETAPPTLASVAELENVVSEKMPVVRSFRVEGIVRAILPERNLIVVQDASASALFELPALNPVVAVGDQVVLKSEFCRLTRTRHGIKAGTAPVIDNDGIHSRLEKAGSVFLPAGKNPIHLSWFNGAGVFALNLDYEGPAFSRIKVPSSVLWHSPDGVTNLSGLVQGLQFKNYEGIGWRVLPDFSMLKPVGEGIARNFSVAYRTRSENCALVFDGFIDIEHPGVYTFYLRSDDGSQLDVGRSSVSCEVIGPPSQAIPNPESFEQALAHRDSDRWIEAEGEVAFVSQSQRSLEIELVAGGFHVPVSIIDGTTLFATNLLHRWIRVEGNCEFSHDPADKKLVGIVVPGAAQVKIYDHAGGTKDFSANNPLTTAAQVRRLKATEALNHIPSKIRGVVIYSTSSTMVLQDASGGVFTGCRAGNWAEQPRLGELWEIQGTTDPGDFSPVVVADSAKYLGEAPLPEPIVPTRDQLMNGNLDAEYGELHGVLTEASKKQITLLTSDGKVTIVGSAERPLPTLPTDVPDGGSLLGSVLRIRGCFATLVDLQTHQVTPGTILLYPALVEVEDPPPSNPFVLPVSKASELMWFDARASALHRTKLSGQLLYTLPGEYFIQDGKAGFRVFASDSPPLQTGDLVEAVGFPKLGGPSPFLQEAQIRKTGHDPLPKPERVSPNQLLAHGRDSTLVQVEASLIGDTFRNDEKVLELQSGPTRFLARVKANPRDKATIPAGCLLGLTGVYVSADEDHVGASAAPFELLLNSAADIVVIQRPPRLTVERAITVMAIMACALGVTFIWVAMLRRKVDERTAQLKREIEERQLVEQRHAIERERTRVAQDLHDELGAGLTEVSILGSLANTAAVPTETKEQYLDQITQMARSLVTSLDEIVWAVNPHYDSAASLASYFSLFAESFLKLAGIACRFHVAADIPDYPLDSKVRHEVFCAFKEALNNVVRHSGATEVQIGFEVTGPKLMLSVIDNGRGFESVAASPGRDGLTGLRQRMRQLGGDCEITSQPGHGTKIEFHLPSNGVQHAQDRNR